MSYLIGIAGPSGAGKSYLACHLAECLHEPVLALDRYYRDLSHLSLEEGARSNFDEPAALEHELLITHAGELRKGTVIEVPIYGFSTHGRTAGTDTLPPEEFIILEGLFTLHWPRLRQLLGTRVYVDMTDDVCLRRRPERDVHERARTPESVVKQCRTILAPRAERYVRPSRNHAQVLISGAAQIAESVARVVEHIKRQRHRSRARAVNHLQSLSNLRSR